MKRSLLLLAVVLAFVVLAQTQESNFKTQFGISVVSPPDQAVVSDGPELGAAKSIPLWKRRVGRPKLATFSHKPLSKLSYVYKSDSYGMSHLTIVCYLYQGDHHSLLTISFSITNRNPAHRGENAEFKFFAFGPSFT